MKRIIHINRHTIDSNRKNKTCKPPITVKTYKSNNYGHIVQILGPSRVVHNLKKPLSCGAKCWIETESEVLLDNKTRI